MTKLSLFLFLISCLLACSEPKELKFENESIEFTLPSGWHLKKSLSKDSKMVVVQNGKYVSKGIFVITVFEGQKNAQKIIELYKAEMETKKVGPIDANSRFDDPKEGSFGQYQTVIASYGMTVLNKELEGIFHIINHSNKTVVVQLQKMRNQEKVFAEGAQMLENTFRIRD